MTAAHRQEDATVAIVTALPIEFVAVKAMLDDPQELSTAGNAPGEYVLGTVPSKDGGRHVVVLAPCSVAENLAAANTSVLLERFPRISSVIMVGIAGGAPDPSNDEWDVRLGDVVVCGSDGSVQYDYDKESVAEGHVVTEPRYHPRPPSARLLAASLEMQRLALEGKASWVAHTERHGAKLLQRSARPTGDVLHHWEAPFPEVQRQPRQAEAPVVFSGVIASGNKLLKNPALRERLRQKFRAKAVEMEAAGVADATWLQRAGYFVVRGVCDYCDDYKNNDWQQYAAIVAAAYTRGLLERIRSESGPQPTSVQREPLPEYEVVPQAIRTALEGGALQGHARAYSDVLNETLAACRAEIAQASKGEDQQAYWPTLVLDSLAKNISVQGVVPPLGFGDLLLGVAFPSFVAAVRKLWVRIEFDRPDNDDWFAELNASMACSGQFSDLSEGAQTLVVQSAVRRVTRRRQAQWRDEEIRACCADARLARWMAADAHVCALLRATAGDMAAFQNLPEIAEFRFGDDRFEVHWRHLACALCLSELRVLGVHLVPPEVVEALIYLPDVDKRVSEQLRACMLANNPQNDWTLRATCDEPVLDHMLVQSVRVLNEELHRRSPMSDHLTRHNCRAFPHVISEVTSSLTNGAPRYTIPHVSFSLSASHARKLFMGSDLWGNPEFAYRELFQNALDACRYRAARAQHLGVPYQPVIRMFHGRNEDGTEYVECEDNGIGMDRALIASCFAVAGNRFVETEEYRKEREAWRVRGITHNVNSQFGIGVFSYFLVAERLEVETARLATDGEIGTRLHLTVPTASSFFRIVTLSTTEARAASRQRAASRGIDTPPLDAGTRVRLSLRRDLQGQDEMTQARVTCVDALRQNVWFSEVRAEIADYRGSSLVLEAGQLASWIRDATKVEGLDTPFWWQAMSDEGIPPNGGKPAWIFRSRNKGNKPPDSFQSRGRILVDGIVTDAATPGFIVNLAGAATPKLSLDRREIRSDIRNRLEEVVTSAIAQVPTTVSKGLLEDLWYWDPRACHRVSSDRSRKWHEINWTRAFEGAGFTRDEMTRPYLPPFPEKAGYSDDHMDASSVLVELWKIATATPDARDLPKFVLEARGLPSSVRPNLSVVPSPLWAALANVVLGVPEALAAHVGFRGTAAPVVAAYVSWQTGDPVAVCATRLASFAAFLGEEWPASVAAAVEVVDDHEAWLLGFGESSSHWAGPEITTYDVCRFCARSGQTDADATAKFSALAQKLGWTMKVDANLAQAVGIMNEREVRFAALLDGGYGNFAEDIADDRSSLLCRLVNRAPPMPRQPEPQPVLNEEQRAIAKELRWPRSRDLSLAEACTVARKMSGPFANAIRAVRKVALALGRNVMFDEAELVPILLFSDVHWKLAEGYGFLARQYVTAPADALELAKRVAASRHLLWRMSTAEALTVLSEVYAGLQWGVVPLDEGQVSIAISLSYEQAQVLERVGSSGRLAIPKLVMIGLDLGRPLPSIVKDAEALATFGVHTPSATDSYLGVSWSAICDSDGGTP
jgi:nucleoside phosphorylase